MIIHELRIKNFGRFCYKNISLNKGINIVYGINESGKTTIHSFIRSMFFGMDKKHGGSHTEGLYEKYKPWGREYDYSGSIKVEDEGNIFCVNRKFTKDRQKFECINETTGDIIETTGGTLAFLNGMTESGYCNTISNEQLNGGVKKDLAAEVKRYLANFATSKDKELDAAHGLKLLNQKKKYIKSFNTEEKVLELKERIVIDDKEDERLKLLRVKEAELSKQLEKAPSGKEQESIKIIDDFVKGFPDIKNKYKEYQEISDQRKLMINIDDNLEEPGKTAYRKFPLFMIALCLIVVLIILITMGTGTVGICASVGVVFLSGAIMYLCNDRVTEFLVTRECERRLADEQYSRETLDNFNSKIVEKQQEILEYAKRVCPLKELNDEEMFRLEQEINILKNQVEGFVCREDKSEQSIKLELERVTWEKERLEENSRFREERKKEYSELQKILEEEEKDLEALDLAISSIETIVSDINGGFGAGLNPLISEYCKKITAGKYADVIIDENFDIRVLDGDRYCSINTLSLGTIEQIYLAVRLAVADMIDESKKMPILLDDTFVYYDDNRLESTLHALLDLEERQIIIFTCQKREQMILKEADVQYSLIEI